MTIIFWRRPLSRLQLRFVLSFQKVFETFWGFLLEKTFISLPSFLWIRPFVWLPIYTRLDVDLFLFQVHLLNVGLSFVQKTSSFWAWHLRLLLGRSVLWNVVFYFIQLICCNWFSWASSFWWRSFFGLALSEWCFFQIPGIWVLCLNCGSRFCCVRNSKSAIFYFNRFRFPLESDVRRNSFSDCTGSPSIWFVLTCFPGNDDSRTLSEFSGKLPLHCTLESVLS